MFYFFFHFIPKASDQPLLSSSETSAAKGSLKSSLKDSLKSVLKDKEKEKEGKEEEEGKLFKSFKGKDAACLYPGSGTPLFLRHCGIRH